MEGVSPYHLGGCPPRGPERKRDGIPTVAGSRKYVGTDFVFRVGKASRLTISGGLAPRSPERKPGRLTYFRWKSEVSRDRFCIPRREGVSPYHLGGAGPSRPGT